MASPLICAGMEQIGLTHGGEKAQVQSVLLLTDGLANQGITSKDGILAEMKKMQDQGLHAVTIPGDSPYNPAPQISRAPPNQRRGLHVLFGRNARRQQNQQQQNIVPMQVQQAGPPIVQQQMAPAPQPMQQQVVPPPPPPQPMQQQAVPPPPVQQAVPPPPPPPVFQQQVPLLQVADNPPEGATTKPIPSGAKVSPHNCFSLLSVTHVTPCSLMVLCTHSGLAPTMMPLCWRPSLPREAESTTTLTAMKRYIPPENIVQ